MAILVTNDDGVQAPSCFFGASLRIRREHYCAAPDRNGHLGACQNIAPFHCAFDYVAVRWQPAGNRGTSTACLAMMGALELYFDLLVSGITLRHHWLGCNYSGTVTLP